MEKKAEEKIMWLVKQAKDEIFSTGEADISPLLKYIDEQLDKAREEELEWILKNCSGGGNWRRIVNQRVSKLKQ
jgi:hypothetical protein